MAASVYSNLYFTCCDVGADYLGTVADALDRVCWNCSEGTPVLRQRLADDHPFNVFHRLATMVRPTEHKPPWSF